jgi:hypothetical protein
MAQPASVMVDGSDPRVFDQLEKEAISERDSGAEKYADHGAFVRPQHRKLHDPNVSFEEYYYYAQQTRIEEDSHPRTGRETSWLSLIWPSKTDKGMSHDVSDDAKRNFSSSHTRAVVSDDEWNNASRALRTATRGAVFYLITTDILGPFGLPYAFATTGWG